MRARRRPDGGNRGRAGHSDGASGFAYGARHWHSPLTSRFVSGVVALFLCAAGLLIAHTELLLAGVGLLVGATVAPTLINGNTLPHQP